MEIINPRLPEVFRVTLIPEVGYIIPQSNFVNYAVPRIGKANFPPVLYVLDIYYILLLTKHTDIPQNANNERKKPKKNK